MHAGATNYTTSLRVARPSEFLWVPGESQVDMYEETDDMERGVKPHLSWVSDDGLGLQAGISSPSKAGALSSSLNTLPKKTNQAPCLHSAVRD